MTQNSINNSASDFAVDNLYLDGNTLSSTDTNGDIVLAPDGTGTVSITAAPIVPSGDRADSLGSATNSWDNVYADGLTFDDGSNVLADYDETGSFTPGIAFGGGTTGLTYSTQTGTYSRIGTLVWIVTNIVLTNKGSSTGAATITGLPIAATSFSALTCYWGNVSLSTNYTNVIPIVLDATTTAQLQEQGDNVGYINMTHASFANTTQIVVTGLYQVGT